MSEKDSAASRGQRGSKTDQQVESETSCFATWLLGSVIFAAFLVQAFVGDHQLCRDLALSWQGLSQGFLWQPLTFALALPEQMSRIASMSFLLCLDYFVSLTLLLGLGYQLERHFGSWRLAGFYFSSMVFSSVLLLVFADFVPGLGQVLSGPLPLALSILGLSLFALQRVSHIPRRNLPILFFVVSIFYLVLCLIEFGLADRTQTFRASLTCLPMILVGPAFVRLDDFITQKLQQRANEREVNLIIEEVNARIQVERLLSKISEFGMGSLTLQERDFLKGASRFYRQDSSRHKE